MPHEDQSKEKTLPSQSPEAGYQQTVLATSVTADAYIGALVKERYRVEKELGRGGFGAVYLARDEQLHSRPVVIKVLLEQAGQGEWFSKKFREEREALARIDHPGVVGVLDVGEMPDGRPFLVMQFVDGVTLRRALQEQEFSFQRVGEIVRRIGQALSAAHDRGIWHRDLKPENIMLQDLGEGEELVKIIDFGIASVQQSQGATSADVTRVAGSQSYMAPEQLLGRPSSASDIYSLGVIAYEMLTGQRPFQPDSPAQLYLLQQQGVQTKPVELCPNLPMAAQECILQALSFDAAKRPARARDFGEQLARALTASPQTAQPLPRDPQRTLAATQPAWARTVPVSTAGDQPSLEMAHVLFMDIVGYSLLPMDQQAQTLHQLQEIVRGTSEFQRAEASDELIRLPTGDGMALSFFRDPVSPVHCALEVQRALGKDPEIKLRMGIHSGPVYRVADINANRNVSGGGINMAQRVMDCGDAGHILLSRVVAETLVQIGNWASAIHDLGEQEVKHGVRIHIFNLASEEFGNRELPRKLQAAAVGKAHAAPTAAAATGARRSRKPLVAGVAALAVLLVAILAATVFRSGAPSAPDVPAAPAEPLREFQYSVLVQRYRDGQPYREPFQVPGEMIFEKDYRIRLSIHSPEPGFLYLLNEGPLLTAGMPSFNILFPGENESALVNPGRTIRIPAEEEHWIVFDEQEGTEKLWMVWAAAMVPELEDAKQFGQTEYQGMISDPEQARKVQEFLQNQQGSPPEVERDETNQQTHVRGRGEILVKLVNLEHH